ncbi:MAG: hypothetical protein GDA36_00745 [Rhodobacteraceae bacterium]|nr:hypothetical protein [Paracoccaceae bacterium]
MTALKQYQRLEATALWRPRPGEQLREVIVSIGEATLIISDLQDRALTHWSLAAVGRQNPGQHPATYSPDGDRDEMLELDEDESEMIAAIEKLRQAVERSRLHPGRRRFMGMGISVAVAAVLALLFLWLPGALVNYAVFVVPAITRVEIGTALLSRIERLGGTACATPRSIPARDELARRTGVPGIEVLPGGIRETLHLPGGLFLLNKALIEDYEDPAVPAGFILAERIRTADQDPLAALLKFAGVRSTLRLITTGHMTGAVLDGYAKQMFTAQPQPVNDAALLAEFASFQLSPRPYAAARDVTGESTLAFIETDLMDDTAQMPVFNDSSWIRLQAICSG